LSYDYQIEGLNPVVAGTGGRNSKKVKPTFKARVGTMVEQLLHNHLVKGLNPAIAGTGRRNRGIFMSNGVAQ
jgi:hypothetical protein